MRLFKKDSQKLTPISEVEFDLEKGIQKLTEANLEAIFGFEFVASEFNLESFWLDTLALNQEAKAFVIIEYKKKRHLSIMDQGQAYLNLLLDHKADVLLAYNELKNKYLKKSDINWDQTRVMFIAPSFSPYQKRAIHAKSPFQLWQVKMYRDNLIGYNQILPISQVAQSAPTLTGSAGKEIKVNTREDVVNKWSDSQKDILNAIEEQIFELGSNIEETFGISSVSFKTQRSFLQVWYSKGKEAFTLYFPEGRRLVDNKKLLKGRGKQGRYIEISSEEQLSEIEDYLKQAYRNSFS